MPRVYIAKTYKSAKGTVTNTYHELYVFKKGKLGKYTCPVCEKRFKRGRDEWYLCKRCRIKVHWQCAEWYSGVGFICTDCMRGDN